MSSATVGSSALGGTMNKIEEEEKEEQEPPTFITVLYGDNESALFNPRCRTHILLEFIRRKCDCDREVVIDLIDFEGDVKNLSTATTLDYAHEQQSVSSRESYVLVRVESETKAHSGKKHTKYVPLLNNLEEVNPELYDKLNNIVVERPKTREEKQLKKPPAAAKVRLNNTSTTRRASQSPPGSTRRGSRSTAR